MDTSTPPSTTNVDGHIEGHSGNQQPLGGIAVPPPVRAFDGNEILPPDDTAPDIESSRHAFVQEGDIALRWIRPAHLRRFHENPASGPAAGYRTQGRVGSRGEVEALLIIHLLVPRLESAKLQEV